MKIGSELSTLLGEDTQNQGKCPFCRETPLPVGSTTAYGAIIIGKIGSQNNGWFVTLSPQTGGQPEQDFTLQCLPLAHLTHFSQLAQYPELAGNFGLLMAKMSRAMAAVMLEDLTLKAVAPTRETGAALAFYGKCTTWVEKKEHLHLKLFPFRGDLGQPAIVDSTFEKKEVEHDARGAFVRMEPIQKKKIDPERLQHLAQKLIPLLS